MNRFTIFEIMMQVKIAGRVIIDLTRFISRSPPVNGGRICGGLCYPRSPIMVRRFRNARNNTEYTDEYQCP